jgi:hypothetical protein
MTKLISLSIFVASIAVIPACKTGSPEVRNDIIAHMQSVKPALDSCYEIALARNRKTPGGMITVEFLAEAQTGQFKNVLVRRDEVQDPQVHMCVITQVGTLKLAKPPDANTTISYAFHFTPIAAGQ